jgi:hypothetical protein
MKRTSRLSAVVLMAVGAAYGVACGKAAEDECEEGGARKCAAAGGTLGTGGVREQHGPSGGTTSAGGRGAALGGGEPLGGEASVSGGGRAMGGERNETGGSSSVGGSATDPPPIDPPGQFGCDESSQPLGDALSPSELAMKLANFFGQTEPDAELLEARDAGELSDNAELRRQARRLGSLPPAQVRGAEFHDFYLDIEGLRWGQVTHDPLRFPGFTAGVPEAALQELRAFFDAVFWGDGTFADLFLSEVAFVNQDLAAIYGLDPANFGAELTRVELDPLMRPGFLTRAAFLSSFSSYNNSNPMVRGGFIDTKVLGLDIPPAPPGAGSGSLPAGEFTTNRERTVAITSPASCASCHVVYIDPPGFALENYDAVGSWQTVDALGGPIDSVANVFLGDAVYTVSSPRELMQMLSSSESSMRHYVDQLLAFALGRAPNSLDACLAEALVVKMEEGNMTLRELWVEVATSELFGRENTP